MLSDHKNTIAPSETPAIARKVRMIRASLTSTGIGTVLEPAACDVADADPEAEPEPEAGVAEFPPEEGKFDGSPERVWEPPGAFVVLGPLLFGTVIPPLGTENDDPDVIPEMAAASIVGSAARGSIVQALVPAVEAGQAGAVV